MDLSNLVKDIKEVIKKYNIESSYFMGSAHHLEIADENVVDLDMVIVFKDLTVDELQKVHTDFEEICKKYSNGVKVIYTTKRGPIKPKYDRQKIIQLHVSISENLEEYRKRDPLFLYNHYKFHQHIAGKNISELIELPTISLDGLLNGKRSIGFHIQKLKEQGIFFREPKVIDGKIVWVLSGKDLSKEGILNFSVSVVRHLTRDFLQITKKEDDYLLMKIFYPQFSDIDYFIKLKEELRKGNYNFEVEEVREKALNYLKRLEQLAKELS